ncbi:MAG: DNA topoisomerase [Clostridia bacterium]|nr:DNA topoisomerase [Clostridia bacterium]
MARKNEYNDNSIEVLEGADSLRKRPASMLGSNGLDGCQHTVIEIIANSIDEAREGFGNKINVVLFKDGSIEVEDFGRGVPVAFNEKVGKYNWELVYCTLYASGKYNTDKGQNYEYSLGLNGLGATATQYTSEYMDVTVYRVGKKYTLHFEKGEIVGDMLEEEYTGKRTGTITRWKPDKEVFTDTNITAEFLEDILLRQSVVNGGVTFNFRHETNAGFETKEYYHKDGIVDYTTELLGEDYLSAPIFWQDERVGRDQPDRPEYKVKLSCCVAFSNRVNILEYYHNSSHLVNGGAPEKAVKAAFAAEIDAYLKNNGKYNKGESKVTFIDVADCLVFVSNCFSTAEHTSYENQTKKAVTNKFIQDAMTDFLRQNLRIYFIENPNEAAKITNQILINKRAREKSEKERINVKKVLSGSVDMANRVQKFVDCQTKDISKREIYIVEGDSALGSCKQGRDSNFQAIMPVRGKILNCLKAEYAKIFKSDVIIDLLKVLGCGVEISGKTAKGLQSFDLNALRWNKVIICTDADVDGFQIRTLILTMLYRLTPTLIEKGYVYIAESPLYEITDKTKKQTYFAYTEKEKDELLQKLEGHKIKIMRSKGLGENEPEMMWQTTMNPETRRLIKVTPSDAEETARMFDILLGDNLAGRKEYIAANGHLYLDDLDLS